jgi:general secretion pathway protein J
MRLSNLKERGFTLIELLISLAIFTVIGLATVRQLQLLMNTKNASFEDLDLYNDLRAAISLMRFDLSQAFHVQADDLGEEAKLAFMQGQPVARTLFDGRKKEMVFTSLSHRNFYAGRRESEQTEISYFLFNRKGQRLSSLMKRESEFIDNDVFQGGQLYTLVDNVESLEFQYWDDKAARWVDDWSSDQGNYRDRFPRSVRIKLSVAGPKNRKLVVDTRFKIAFPNNEPMVTQF